MGIERWFRRERPKAGETARPKEEKLETRLAMVGREVLTKSGRLSKAGREIAGEIFNELGTGLEETRGVCTKQRNKLKEQERLIRKGLIRSGVRRQLRREWEAEGRDWRAKKEGREYRKELRERIGSNVAMQQIKAEKKILDSVYQQAVSKERQEETKWQISEGDVENFRTKWRGEHNKALPKEFARAALVRQLKEWDETLDKRGFEAKEVANYVAEYKEKTRVEQSRWQSASTYEAKQKLMERIEETQKERERKFEQQKPTWRVRAQQAIPVVMATTVAATPIMAAMTPLPELLKQDGGKRISGGIVRAEERPVLVPRGMETEMNFRPEEAVKVLMEGRRPIDKVIEVHANLPPEVIFYKADGTELGRFRRTAVSEGEIPIEIRRLVATIEGSPEQEGKELLTKLIGRNIRAAAGRGAFSGGSTPATQLAEMIGGFYNEIGRLNPEVVEGIHHPEKYGLGYLWELVGRMYGEEPRTAEEIKEALLKGGVALKGEEPGAGVNRIVEMLCAKMESVEFGKRLVKIYGGEAVLEAYARWVPMGATAEGLPIYGLEAKGRELFGKNLSELSWAERVALIGLIQSPSGYCSSEAVKNRAKVIAELLQKKAIITPEEKNRLLAEIETLVLTKGEGANGWINGKRLPQEVREQIYGHLAMVLEGKIPEGAREEKGKILIGLQPIEMPETRGQMKIDQEIEWRNREMMIRPMDETIKKKMEGMLKETKTGYQLEVKDGRVIDIPAFWSGGKKYPGVAMALYDQQRGMTIGVYDPSEIMTKVPIAPGSTIKPIIAAFLMYEGGYTLETKMSNIPGNWALLSPGLTVKNADDSLNSTALENQLTLAQALAYSTNVYFQKALGEYLAKNPDDGWEKLKAFFGKMGITLRDNEGNGLEGVTDYLAIGSDLGVGIEEMAGVYAAIAAPEARFKDQKMGEVLKQVRKALMDQGLKAAATPTGGIMWAGQSLKDFGAGKEGEFFKTGTVEAGTWTFNVMTGGGITDKDGRSLGIMVAIMGQDEQGKTINLRGYYGSSQALPTAREILLWAAEQTVKETIMTPMEEARDKLTRLWKGEQVNYRVVEARAGMVVFDRFGKPVEMIKRGEKVDEIGMAENGMRIVAVEREGGIFLGLVAKEELGPIRESGREEITQKIKEVCETKEGRSWLVVDENSTSPLLRRIFEDMKKRGQLVAGAEDYGKIMITAGISPGTWLVNGEMVGQYLGERIDKENLTWPQRELAAIIANQEEMEQLNRIVAESRTGISLNDLMWQNGTATTGQRLIRAIIDGEIGTDVLKYQGGERLETLVTLGEELMERARDGRAIHGGRAARFVRGIVDFNRTAEAGERTILGLASD